MNQNEIKQIVAKELAEGNPLTAIQKILSDDHSVNITFLELRLLASEIEAVDWDQFSPKEKEKEEEEISTLTATGETVVEISSVVRPGALANGTVQFASGASCEWMFDQAGQLSLMNTYGDPTPEDMEEFQIELKNALSANGAL